MHARCGMRDSFGSGELGWLSARTKSSALVLKTAHEDVAQLGR